MLLLACRLELRAGDTGALADPLLDVDAADSRLGAGLGVRATGRPPNPADVSLVLPGVTAPEPSVDLSGSAEAEVLDCDCCCC